MIPELEKLYWDLVSLRGVLQTTLDRTIEAIKSVERLSELVETAALAEKEVKPHD